MTAHRSQPCIEIMRAKVIFDPGDGHEYRLKDGDHRVYAITFWTDQRLPPAWVAAGFKLHVVNLVDYRTTRDAARTLQRAIRHAFQHNLPPPACTGIATRIS